jgi:hypothetical protein
LCSDTFNLKIFFATGDVLQLQVQGGSTQFLSQVSGGIYLIKTDTGWVSIRTYALQRHNTENSKQIFPEKELRGLSPNFHINVSVIDLYIPTIILPSAAGNMWTDPGNRSQTHECCF